MKVHIVRIREKPLLKKRKKEKKKQVKEESGNFMAGQGNFERT